MKIEAILSEVGVVDLDGDIIEAGAFDGQLDDGLPMLYMHRRGDIAGTWSNLRMDGSLLRADGEIFDDAFDLADMAAELVTREMIQGVSIGFRVMRYETVHTEERPWGWDIKEIDLREASLVDYPANESAQITEIKQRQKAAQGGAAADHPPGPLEIHKFYAGVIRPLAQVEGDCKLDKICSDLQSLAETSQDTSRIIKDFLST